MEKTWALAENLLVLSCEMNIVSNCLLNIYLYSHGLLQLSASIRILLFAVGLIQRLTTIQVQRTSDCGELGLENITEEGMNDCRSRGLESTVGKQGLVDVTGWMLA